MAALTLALLAGACQGSGNQPAQTAGSVRETTTAPADLQLLCASAATERLGLPATTQVLPTASTRTEGGFDVTLTYTGGGATCAVRDDGTVVSVTAA